MSKRNAQKLMPYVEAWLNHKAIQRRKSAPELGTWGPWHDYKPGKLSDFEKPNCEFRVKPDPLDLAKETLRYIYQTAEGPAQMRARASDTLDAIKELTEAS